MEQPPERAGHEPLTEEQLRAATAGKLRVHGPTQLGDNRSRRGSLHSGGDRCKSTRPRANSNLRQQRFRA